MRKQTAGREGLAAFFLRQRGRLSRELAAAIEMTPRDQFLPAQWSDCAWSDRMVPIDCGEAVEGVDLQAAVITALGIEPAHRVLEVGTGTGYTAALMARLSARVTTVDRFKTLCENAKQRFEALQLTGITVRHADGSSGLPSQGPFDRIVVWAAFESLPRAFVDQLATNGVMVAAIGPGDGEQDLTRLSKVGSRFEREDFERVRFQPIARSVAAII
ncbi:MAG: protein-L-isoaspartate(D-aspartate) O-methyltransferase [Rhizobiaceae bacterium]|nr:protein-L-isoaspartate(D-aspartate) O-methyltransferase [Rhizobiaceae bacterium]